MEKTFATTILVELRKVPVYHSDLNAKVLEGAFNQERALVGATSMIVKSLQRFVSSSKHHPPLLGAADHTLQNATNH